LKWTRRLSTVAGVAALLIAVAVVTSVGFFGSGHNQLALLISSCVALGIPVLIDLALAVLSPVEAMLAKRFVREASAKLHRIKPTIVAITGSYGKTSTKNYVAHLLSQRYSVVATPASFNNMAGLSRAVNEKLALGTEIFVAEMGTYGAGEIEAMCAWMVPAIAVITAIGPVHLERMKTLDRVLEAKSEITHKARQVVLNGDDPMLASLGGKLQSEGKTVRMAHATDVSDFEIPKGASPTNVACAIGVARLLGLDEGVIRESLASLPDIPNRRVVHKSGGGFEVIDDTFNSNPAGCREALELLASTGSRDGRKVVVTPGMIELGSQQDDENFRFIRQAARVASDIIVVGRTNRNALKAGASGTQLNVVRAATRNEAVDWVKTNLGEGDAVLYENDLPDHFP